jgi:hypothetical protein
MNEKEYWILVLSLVSILNSIGCSPGWEYGYPLVKAYAEPASPNQQFATLIIPSCREIRLQVDGRIIEWDDKFRNVKVELLAGSHTINWTRKGNMRTWIDSGNGTLNAKSNAVYLMKFDYLLDVDGSRFLVEGWRSVKAHTTWIENIKTGEVVIGRSPFWTK